MINKKSITLLLLGLVLLVLPLTRVMSASEMMAYKDVNQEHWHYEYVKELTEQGVFDGKKSYFFPSRPMTRAEMVKAMVDATMGVIDNLPEEPSFTDVPKNSWFFPYVESGLLLGIIQGDTDENGEPTGFFRPNDSVSRAEAAKMITTGIGVDEYSLPQAPFTDVDTTAWYMKFVSSLYNWSIVDGYRDTGGSLTGKFGPEDKVTRAEAAKMISIAKVPVNRHK